MADDSKISTDVAAGAVVRFIRAGNALARAIGHLQGCPKLSAALPCTCGSGDAQAQMLHEWYELVREYSNAS